MINWNNLDTLTSFKELSEVERVNLAEVMSGENGAERVKDYSQGSFLIMLSVSFISELN